MTLLVPSFSSRPPAGPDSHQPSAISPKPENLADASGSGLTADGLRLTAPASWIRAADLQPHLPGDSDSARRHRLHRELATLRRCGNARRTGGRWTIAPDALVCGRPARAWLASKLPTKLAGHELPPGHERWSDKDRQRFLDTHELLRHWSEFRDQHPRLTADECAKLFAVHRIPDSRKPSAISHNPDGLTAYGLGLTAISDWCSRRRLRCTAKSLRTYAARVRRDGNVDRRGYPAGLARGSEDPRLLDRFAEVALHENGFTLAEAWRQTRDLAQELGLPIKSLRWWQQWFPSAYPKFACVAAKRPRKFIADHLPKIERHYTDIAPLEWVSLDGHVLNVRCQAADCAKTGKSIRPTLTGVLDIRTRKFVGWDLRPTENADGILAGLLRMYRDHGAPRNIYADNGEAYKASLGHRRQSKARKLYSDPRLADLCAATGATRHNALPYAAWAKMIESHWNHVVQRFEKYFESWFGSSITDRPEDAMAVPVWELPTLADVEAAWTEFLKAHHAEPQQGDGMYGLSPDEAMAQFRTEVRRVDEDVLRFVCARPIGQRTIGRDGVRLGGVSYGRWDEDVWRLQGQAVQIKADPTDASFVWLWCEAKDTLVLAHARQLTGATPEEVRDAARFRAKCAKELREYLPKRDFLRKTTPQQIMARKAERAQERAAQRAQSLPAATAPDVSIVGAALAEPVRRAVRSVAADPRVGRPGTPDPDAQAELDAARRAFDLLSRPMYRPPADADEAEEVCPADLLKRWVHAG